MKSDYISQNDAAFAALMQKFKLNIPSYATTLGLTTAQLAAQAADADYMDYVVSCQQTMLSGGQQWTAWKNLVRGGGTPPPTGVPAAPTLPASVTPVGLGIEVRFRALVKLIKAHPGYNESMGEALGIEGAAHTAPDLTTIQPTFDLTLSGDQVSVNWGWQGQGQYLDQCEIQVDRGDGKGFALLAIDTTPGYTDTQPLPATPTKWTYRAIYRAGDNRTGTWSNPVSITVGG